MTVQSMPRSVRRAAIASVRDLVAPGGTLLVIGGVATPGGAPGPPWPLDRSEMESFGDDRLVRVGLDDVSGSRWCAALAWGVARRQLSPAR